MSANLNEPVSKKLKKKAVVSFSSGLDSSVCLYWAKKNYDEVSALFFNYGQKALESERRNASQVCEKLQIKLTEVDISFIGDYSNSALNSIDSKIPTETVDIDSLEESQKSAEKVWVPNRNGVFISLAASYAEATGAQDIILGFNKEEAQTFPDNSESYISRVNEALIYSTQERVKVISPTIDLEKKEIYQMAETLDVDFSLVWPCYFSGEKPCGKCESCQRYNRAAGIK